MLPVLIGVTVLCFILMTASGKDPALAVAMRSNSAKRYGTHKLPCVK